MTFDEWSAAIVAGVRAQLPDATAVRKGRRLVIIRHGDRAVLLANDGSFWVTFTADDLNITVYWVYSGFDRSPEIQKDGAAIYGECNCSVARSGPRDGGRWRNVPRLY
jgi:hypothetical protein